MDGNGVEEKSTVKAVLENIARDIDEVNGDDQVADPETDDKLAADLALKLDLKDPVQVAKLEAEIEAKVVADNDFGKIRNRWVQESNAFHQQEMRAEDTRYRVVAGMNPKTDEDWKEICNKMFGARVVNQVVTGDLHVARTGSRSGLPFNRNDQKNFFQNLFQWLIRSEQFFMRGMRVPQWIEPGYDDLFAERKFAEVVPVGVGYDHAVILGRLENTKHQDAPWNFFVCALSKLPERPRFVNWRTAKENHEIMTKFKEDSQRGVFNSAASSAVNALKKDTSVAYLKSSCGPVAKPSYMDIHGDWVSVVWTSQTVASKKTDVMHLYKLPKMLRNPGDFVELVFPEETLSHYDLHWPFMVFVCNTQEIFDIEWIAGMSNFKAYKVLKNTSPVKEFIFVVNLVQNVIARAWEVPGTGSVGYLSLYPPKNSVLCASVPAEEVKVMWTCEDPNGPTHRALFEDYMLRGQSEEIEVNYLWKRAEHEIELRRTKNISYKSQPDEAARVIRRAHGGHTVMISDNNVSTLIRENPPLYPTPEIYFGRDQVVLDRAIYLNTVVTLFADYTIGFSCARAAESDKAVTTVSRFSVKELVDYGDNPGRVMPPSRVLHYKAIWMAVDRIVVQFQDGMLVFLSVMSEQDLASMKELNAKARMNYETKNRVKDLVEKKVTEAANELLAKQKSDASPQSMEH